MCLFLLGMTALLTRSRSRRLYYDDGQYLVSVRYPGRWRDIREFIQPANPDILRIYSQVGPDYWPLFDFVCRYINYRTDRGEFWQLPSETLRGEGDCEDTSILLTSLLRVSINAYVAVGSYAGYGHAWCYLNGQILETTYTHARSVPDPQDYEPYVLFNDREVIELWPNALHDLFGLGRDEATKLGLMAASVDIWDAYIENQRLQRGLDNLVN